MKSLSRFVAAVVVGCLGTVGSAFAIPVPGGSIPEPGTLALVGLAVVGLIAVSRKGRK